MHPQHERRVLRLHISPAREEWFHYAPILVVVAAILRVAFILVILTLRALPSSTTFFNFPGVDDPTMETYPGDQRFLPIVADPFGPLQGALNSMFDGFLGAACALIVLNGIVWRITHRGRRPFRNPSWAGPARERSVIIAVAFLALLELGAWAAMLGLFYALKDEWLGAPDTRDYFEWLEAELPDRSDLDARGRVLYPLLHVLQVGVAITALEMLVRVTFLFIGRVVPSSWRSASLPDTGKVTLDHLDTADGILAKGFAKMLDRGRQNWERWRQEQAAQTNGLPTSNTTQTHPPMPHVSLPLLRLDDTLEYWKAAPYRDNTYTGLAAQGLVFFGLFCVALQLATFGVLLHAEWNRGRCAGACSLTWAGPVYWVLFVVAMFTLVKVRVPLGRGIAGPVTVAWLLKIMFVAGAALNVVAFWWIVSELEEFDGDRRVALDVVGILYGIGCIGGVVMMGLVLLLPNKKLGDPTKS